MERYSARCFGDRNIERGRIRRKNDLAEFFVYYGLISLQGVSSDQETSGDLFDDLKFDWETQNSGFRSVSGDSGSVREVHRQDYIALHVRCGVSDAVEFGIIRRGENLVLLRNEVSLDY